MLSIQIQQQIPILYKKFKTYSKVAKELNISPSTVSKYIKKQQETPKIEKTIKTYKKIDEIQPIKNIYDLNWKDAIILSSKEWSEMPYEEAI